MRKNDGENSTITRDEESRGSDSNLRDPNLEFDQESITSFFSERIPDVWKIQTFTMTPFTIKKCRDLK